MSNMPPLVGDNVQSLRRYFDEASTVSLDRSYTVDNSSNCIAWPRIVLEKFTSRVIPRVQGGLATRKQAPLIKKWAATAQKFGNSTVIVDRDGYVRLANPDDSRAWVTPFGTVFFEEVLTFDDGYGGIITIELYGRDGVLYNRDLYDPDVIDNSSAEVGAFFSILKDADSSAPCGRSRLTPAMRRIVDQAVVNSYQLQEVMASASHDQRVLNGITPDMEKALRASIEAIRGGTHKIVGLPAGENGEKISIESFKAEDATNFLRVQESLQKQMAAAGNLYPQELGVIGPNPASAEAMYASKEDLILEVKAWEEEITEVCEAFLVYVAEVNGEEEPTLKWDNPATPSQNAAADSIIKIASAIDTLRKAPELAEAIFEYAGINSGLPAIIASLPPLEE